MAQRSNLVADVVEGSTTMGDSGILARLMSFPVGIRISFVGIIISSYSYNKESPRCACNILFGTFRTRFAKLAGVLYSSSFRLFLFPSVDW